MSYRHILLALAVAAIWGFNFVVIKFALTSFPPLLLTAMRFALAALPAFFIPRPQIPWTKLIPVAIFLFIGQYGFLFVGMAKGMPPGLASVTLQAQAFLTIIIAAIALREQPKVRQIVGTTMAFGGLLLASTTIGMDVTGLGFTLTLLGAASWAVGNVLMRRLGGGYDAFALVVWLSLVPPLPLFVLSLLIEGPATIGNALASISILGVLCLLYIVALSTLMAFAFWSMLLRRYPAATVAPFSLLVPVFGIVSSILLTGESFDWMRLGAVALILAGLAVVALPIKFGRARRAAPAEA